MYLVKTDSSGALEWETTHGGTGDGLANSVRQTEDGGSIAAGWLFQQESEDTSMLAVKTNSRGRAPAL